MMIRRRKFVLFLVICVSYLVPLAAFSLTLSNVITIPRNASPSVARDSKQTIGIVRHDFSSFHRSHAIFGFVLEAKKSKDDEDEDDEDASIELDDDDWRSFRAKLVMGEKPSIASQPSSSPSETSPSTIIEDDFDGIGAIFQDAIPGIPPPVEKKDTASLLKGMTPLDPSQWAYDSGKVIEEGAVILGGVEQDYGFGLRQQYFHKAAILVIEHEETTFTRGIILNRPTDLLLEDEINPGVKWRVWFGGDVQGIDSQHPSIVCLHSMKSRRVVEASVPVMKDIQWTTFDNAKKLVKAGEAQASNFWVFVGYAGWSPGQLMGELDRRSWYMVATDSGTLLKELARQGATADPRDAGLDTWDLLMNMIGRQETAKKHSGGFDDLILKEWAFKHLLSTEAGGGGGLRSRTPTGMPPKLKPKPTSPMDLLFPRSNAAKVTVGSLVRASSAERSPFLLQNQDLHKSIVLIIADDENLTIGVILNRPVTQSLDINVNNNDTGGSRKAVLPVRYGGQYNVKSIESLLWFHCSATLRLARIGQPVGDNQERLWKCSAEDVVSAVKKGLAKPEDFIVVTGVCIWTKSGLKRGMQGEIEESRFEVIPDKNIPQVWNALTKQEVLKDSNLMRNLAVAEEAWIRAGEGVSQKKKNGDMVPIGGLGDGFDEEDDSLVFKSDVKVSRLSDDALRSWISTFILALPFLDD